MQKKEDFFTGFELGSFPDMLELLIKHYAKEIC